MTFKVNTYWLLFVLIFSFGCKNSDTKTTTDTALTNTPKEESITKEDDVSAVSENAEKTTEKGETRGEDKQSEEVFISDDMQQTAKVTGAQVVKSSKQDEQEVAENTNPEVKAEEDQDNKPENPPLVEEAPVVTEKPTPTPSPAKGLHEGFDDILRQNVNSRGDVNYKAIKAERQKLESYLQQLEETGPQSSWSSDKKLAYWINAYNAYTIKLIIDNYPVKSITDLEGGKPWDKKWIKLDGKALSLNQIENEIIRPTFNDPRIHFAVNCAAKSCPPIWNRAYSEANLNLALDKRTKTFINNPAFNSIEENRVEVSKIFDWYAEDFGNLIDFLNKYSDQKINSNADVEYQEYNWALNKL